MHSFWKGYTYLLNETTTRLTLYSIYSTWSSKGSQTSLVSWLIGPIGVTSSKYALQLRSPPYMHAQRIPTARLSTHPNTPPKFRPCCHSSTIPIITSSRSAAWVMCILMSQIWKILNRTWLNRLNVVWPVGLPELPSALESFWVWSFFHHSSWQNKTTYSN